MRPISRDMKRQAKEIRLMDYLYSTYGWTFKRKGGEFFCQEHDSLLVNPENGYWYWNSRKTGGANCIDFLMKLENRTFVEAVSILVGNQIHESAFGDPVPRVHRKKFILPEKNFGYQRMYAYLNKTRGISSKVIQHFQEKGLLYEDIKHNVVFVGYCKEKAVYAFLRGTNTENPWKQEVSGSKKEYSFSYSGTSNRLYVFESAIDILSFITKYYDCGWSKHHYLSLGGLQDKAFDQYLKDHPEVEQVCFCLDWDAPGIVAATEKMIRYGNKYHVSYQHPQFGKDWNDDIIRKMRLSSFYESYSKYPQTVVYSTPQRLFDCLMEHRGAGTSCTDHYLLLGDNQEENIKRVIELTEKKKLKEIYAGDKDSLLLFLSPELKSYADEQKLILTNV